MKTSKNLIILFSAFVLIFGASIFFGCSDDSGGSASVPVTGVSLNKASTSIVVGYTKQLHAIIVPEDATNQNVAWSSSDETIATVSSSGLVTAVALGTAEITVTTEDSGFTATCAVTVTPMINVTGVSLNKSSTTIAVGATEQLIATITPEDATNKNVSWSSSNTGIATVSSAGLVKAEANGTATITVTTVDAGFTATCTVTVPIPDPGHKVTYTADSVSFIMAYVPGDITFPTGTDDFDGEAIVTNALWIGETEVTYELWYKVYTWATSGSGITGAGEYTFTFGVNAPRAGHDGTPGSETDSQEPVTCMNWRHAMVWCNALTEWYNAQQGTSYSCVYYTDSGYTTPIRIADDSDSVTYPDPGGQDDPYINSDANGFRLLTSDEWELAARWRNDDTNTVAGYSNPWFTKGNSMSGAYTYWNDVADINPANGIVDGKDANDAVAIYYRYWDGSWQLTGVSGTAEVKSKGTNGANDLGLYDMSGNVYEWCFDWFAVGSHRVVRGGSWNEYASYLQVGHVVFDEPCGGSSSIGFRFARIE